MDNGSLPLCTDLGQSQEHTLLYWLGRKATKLGIVRLEYEKLIERAARGAFGSSHAARRTERTLVELKSAGYIEKVDVGDSYGFRILVICPGQKNPVEDLTEPSAVRRQRTIVATAGRGDGSSISMSLSDVATDFTTNGSEKWHPIAQNQAEPKTVTGRLAKTKFPQVLAARGIHLSPLQQAEWPALAQHLGRWSGQGVPISQIHRMMEEFARHPDWVNRSAKPAWQVFVGRKGQLDAILRAQRSREPTRSNRWGRPTPVASFVR